jgi:hypothetical protein
VRIAFRTLLLGAFLLLGGVGMALDEDIVVDFEGFGYEAGGFDFSDPGDELHLITRITNIVAPQPDFPYDPITYEYTLVVTGLISNGEMVDGSMSTIVYNLGTLAIYEDSSFNSSWDEYPEIGNPPSSFFDGTLYLYGDFTDFTMVLFRDLGIGSFEGHVSLTGGSAMDWFSAEGYTFGGTLIPPHNPGIPDGYHLSLDGELWVEEPVATHESTWSSFKALY